MPVQTFDAKGSEVDTYRRLSASQLGVWRSCPRQWYYSYEERLKGPMPPHIIRGNAGEECVCRVLQGLTSAHCPRLHRRAYLTTQLRRSSSIGKIQGIGWGRDCQLGLKLIGQPRATR